MIIFAIRSCVARSDGSRASIRARGQVHVRTGLSAEGRSLKSTPTVRAAGGPDDLVQVVGPGLPFYDCFHTGEPK